MCDEEQILHSLLYFFLCSSPSARRDDTEAVHSSLGSSQRWGAAPAPLRSWPPNTADGYAALRAFYGRATGGASSWVAASAGVVRGGCSWDTPFGELAEALGLPCSSWREGSGVPDAAVAGAPSWPPAVSALRRPADCDAARRVEDFVLCLLWQLTCSLVTREPSAYLEVDDAIDSSWRGRIAVCLLCGPAMRDSACAEPDGRGDGGNDEDSASHYLGHHGGPGALRCGLFQPLVRSFLCTVLLPLREDEIECAVGPRVPAAAARPHGPSPDVHEGLWGSSDAESTADGVARAAFEEMVRMTVPPVSSRSLGGCCGAEESAPQGGARAPPSIADWWRGSGHHAGFWVDFDLADSQPSASEELREWLVGYFQPLWSATGARGRAPRTPLGEEAVTPTDGCGAVRSPSLSEAQGRRWPLMMLTRLLAMLPPYLVQWLLFRDGVAGELTADAEPRAAPRSGGLMAHLRDVLLRPVLHSDHDAKSPSSGDEVLSAALRRGGASPFLATLLARAMYELMPGVEEVPSGQSRDEEEHDTAEVVLPPPDSASSKYCAARTVAMASSTVLAMHKHVFPFPRALPHPGWPTAEPSGAQSDLRGGVDTPFGYRANSVSGVWQSWYELERGYTFSLEPLLAAAVAPAGREGVGGAGEAASGDARVSRFVSLVERGVVDSLLGYSFFREQFHQCMASAGPKTPANWFEMAQRFTAGETAATPSWQPVGARADAVASQPEVGCGNGDATHARCGASSHSAICSAHGRASLKERVFRRVAYQLLQAREASACGAVAPERLDEDPRCRPLRELFHVAALALLCASPGLEGDFLRSTLEFSTSPLFAPLLTDLDEGSDSPQTASTATTKLPGGGLRPLYSRRDLLESALTTSLVVLWIARCIWQQLFVLSEIRQLRPLPCPSLPLSRRQSAVEGVGAPGSHGSLRDRDPLAVPSTGDSPLPEEGVLDEIRRLLGTFAQLFPKREGPGITEPRLDPGSSAAAAQPPRSAEAMRPKGHSPPESADTLPLAEPPATAGITSTPGVRRLIFSGRGAQPPFAATPGRLSAAAAGESTQVLRLPRRDRVTDGSRTGSDDPAEGQGSLGSVPQLRLLVPPLRRPVVERSDEAEALRESGPKRSRAADAEADAAAVAGGSAMAVPTTQAERGCGAADFLTSEAFVSALCAFACGELTAERSAYFDDAEPLADVHPTPECHQLAYDRCKRQLAGLLDGTGTPVASSVEGNARCPGTQSRGAERVRQHMAILCPYGQLKSSEGAIQVLLATFAVLRWQRLISACQGGHGSLPPYRLLLSFASSMEELGKAFGTGGFYSAPASNTLRRMVLLLSAVHAPGSIA